MANNMPIKDGTGADTSVATVESGNVHTPKHIVVDTAGNAITTTALDGKTRLDVILSSGGAPGVTAPTNANLVGGTDGTNLRALSVDSDGRLNTNARNVVTRFRDGFQSYTPGTNWNATLGSGDLVYADGNVGGASYLVISKNPLVADSQTTLESIPTFRLPVELAIGLSMSQRTLGQEFSVEIVDTDPQQPVTADIAIASITQTTTVLTVATATPHGLTVGRAIGIVGCSNPLVNYPALVVASVPDPVTFTATAGPGGTIPSQTVTNPAGAKGSVFIRERLGRANNGVSQIFENATATNASLYIRSASGDALPSGALVGNQSATIGTTASVALVNGAYQYAWTPTSEYRILMQSDRTQWADTPVDGLAALSARLTRSQVCPDPASTYRLRIRANNSKSLTTPTAQIVSAAKTGTTTATVTTATAHGLVAGDVVVAYGVREQAAASFPNLLTATAVASVIDATSFTIVWGTAGTVTSYGGYVAKVQGGNLMSALGGIAQVAQSATLATLADGTRQLTVVGNAAWAGLAIGDLVNLVGVRDNTVGASLGVDGAWKVANLATTTLTLVLPFSGSMVLPSDFASTNCGGAVIRRTDMRISYVRAFDYERQRMELTSRPGTDVMGSMPTQITNTPAVTVSSGTITTVTTVTGVTTVSAVTSSNSGIPGAIADVASAALTTTTTTAAFTPTFGTSYEVNIPVTAVTGTNPTLDVDIEESDDTGTNWYKVYSFPRITATGMYRSPKLPLTGNRVRYVQTVGGTTPSFTRAVNRLQSSDRVDYVRQIIDRSVSLTTLSSTTPSATATTLNVQNCKNVQLIVNIGAVTTTAPALQLQGSDDNGASWYPIGTPLTAVPSSTVALTVNNVNTGWLRAIVTTAGVGVTPGYVLLKGF